MTLATNLDRLLAAIGAALVVATVIVLASYGKADTGGSQAAAPATGGLVTKIVIQNFKYTPNGAQVKVGTKLTFVNQDSAPHTATSSDGKVLDTGLLKQGEKKVVTFKTPGTIAYICSVHPFMKATLKVVS